MPPPTLLEPDEFSVSSPTYDVSTAKHHAADGFPVHDQDATVNTSDPDSDLYHGLSFCGRITLLVQRVIPYGGVTANVFSLGSVTLGGAIVSMPSSFATSGIIMALIYLVVIVAITVYTMTMMGICMRKTGARTFEELAFITFGRGWDYFVGFILWLSCIGTAIGYVTTVSTLITPLLQKAPSTPEYLKTKSGNQLITSLIWLCGMVPVILPKHINSIRYVSAFGVCMVLYFVVTIVVHSCTNGLKEGMRDDMAYFTTGNKAIYGLSIFVFAYLCQAVAGSVYWESPKPSVRQLTVSSAISMGACTVLYVLAGVFGYFDFGTAVEDSVLENFDPIHQPYMMVAYIGVLVKVCAAFAMNMVPCRNFIYHCLRWDIEELAYWKHILVVVLQAFVCLMAGLFIPSVNLAFGLVGSLCGGFIGFLFPAYFWMYSGNWSLRTVGVFHWAATYFVIVAGVIAIVFGTIATIYSSFVDK